MRSRLLVLALFFVMSGFAPAVPAAGAADSGGPCPMPPSPDLLTRLGKERVAELAGDFRPEKELYVAARQERGLAKSAQVTGTGTCLVILLEWTDHPADKVSHPNSEYVDMMFSTGAYPTGSMNDYYREISHGLYGVQGTVHGWAQDDDPYSSITPTDYYQVRDLMREAVLQLDPVIDYSQFDNDGPDGVPNSGDDDGRVDALFFVHAGPGREATGDDNDIWSHAWSFSDAALNVDGVQCYSYSVEPEESPDGSMVAVGVFCHEYGHVLGLPDLYDTDYSTAGVGEWCLMSGGSWGRRPGDPPGSCPVHMTAWCKEQLGWVDPVAITASTLGLTVPRAEDNPVAYRVWRAGDASGDEYFLIENRRPVGFDEALLRRQIDYGLPQPEGLIIYHVDNALNGNANERHRLVDVVEASPWFDGPGDWFEQLDGPRDYATGARLDAYNRGDDGDVWPGYSAVDGDTTSWVGPRDRDRFADDTIPPAHDYYCEPTGITLQNIAISGDDVVLDVLIEGAKGGDDPPPPAATALSWDFESGLEGWEFCNSYVHLDQTQAGSCGGTGLWFGVDDPAYECGPGYGNNWFDITWHQVQVSGSPTVTLTHHYDLEPNYDYGVVEVRCANDPLADWHQVAAVTGSSGCVTDTWPLPTAALTECADGDPDIMLDLRLRLLTDGGYSAEDGSFCGFGWWVGEVTLDGVLTDVGDTPRPMASASLLPPWPNPFNPVSAVKYYVPEGVARASLRIYDQRGRVVRNLAADMPAGWGETTWNGRDDAGRALPSGIYYCRLIAGSDVLVRKLALLK